MRGLLIVPIAVTVPVVLFSALRMVTGDALSAVLVELLLLATFAAWFSRPSGRSRPMGSRSF